VVPGGARWAHNDAGGRLAGRCAAIDKVISSVVITIAGMLAVMAVIRFIMPPLADATNSLASSRDTVTSDIDHVITIGAVSMPDGTTVDIWAKNVGSAPMRDLALMSVAFGLEANAVPFAYGGAGCPAPCWSYDAGGADAWSPGETIAVRIELSDAAESGALHRVTVMGPRSGQATATVRAP
jgi:hypothetical protein